MQDHDQDDKQDGFRLFLPIYFTASLAALAWMVWRIFG